jgi:hypothetical protein
VKKLLFIALLAGLGWLYFHESPASWRGFPASGDPTQTSAVVAPFASGDYRVTPLASYRVTAVVLSRCRYRYDASAPISPIDLALGWGPMSIASVINDLRISQSGRWYEYSWRNEPPLDPSLIATHSANTHCLPANADVRRALLAVKRHDLVTLEGYLVEVNGPGGFRWRSSLTRDDTGGGSCEILWVTAVNSRRL